MVSRRKFLKNTTATAAGLSLVPSLSANLARVQPNDKINVGVIGCNGQGFSNLRAFLQNPEVECIALCDVDESVLNRRAEAVEKMRGQKPANLYRDWRKGNWQA